VKISREFQVACVIQQLCDVGKHEATFKKVHAVFEDIGEEDLSSILDTLFDWGIIRVEHFDGLWRYQIQDDQIPLIRKIIVYKTNEIKRR
jgi:hypothetical protein